VLSVLQPRANGLFAGLADAPDRYELLREGRRPARGSGSATQNDLGGPFTVQASACDAIEQRLDCGPLFVGENGKDKAEFRLSIATADAIATARLNAMAAGVGSGYGMNMSCPVCRPAP
jgi:hypothetical protein